MPVSVIETMVCGLPIVASDIRGHRDNVVDGENGFLFALGDNKRMCDGVFDIYKSMELHERFSRNSVELAKKYDLKSIRLKMAKIYDEVESGVFYDYMRRFANSILVFLSNLWYA